MMLPSQALVKVKLVLVTLICALLFLPMVSTQAKQTKATSNWNLVWMFSGMQCASYRNGSTPDPTLWLLVTLSGTWTNPVNFGLRDVPAGGTVALKTFVNGEPEPYQPIPPGSGDGSGGARGRVELTLHQGSTPTGTYSTTLWASDGTTQHTIPVTLVVQNPRCTGY